MNDEDDRGMELVGFMIMSLCFLFGVFFGYFIWGM
jgi:hypothetical protein